MNYIYKVHNPKWAEPNWYDRWDTFIVIAKTNTDIKELLCNYEKWDNKLPEGFIGTNLGNWRVDIVGQSEMEPQVLLGSFNRA